jgi:acyl-CoA thioesterase-2
MEPLIADLLECLDLEALAPSAARRDRFRGRCEIARSDRIFGGQVIAQSLMAAGRTVEDRPAHSLQALFLEIGDPTRPIGFEVERLRDGRSFSARRVLASQGERVIFSMQASFHAIEPGYEHQSAAPEAPDPESLPTAREQAAGAAIRPESAYWAARPRPVEVRHAVLPSYLGGPPTQEPNRMWFRFEADLPDDPLLHQCLLGYVSDVALNDTAYRPHSGPDAPRLQFMSSVDHTMWFHVPARADRWTLYLQESPRAAGARGFARGAMYARDGTLVASVGQDSAMRPAAPPGRRSPE